METKKENIIFHLFTTLQSTQNNKSNFSSIQILFYSYKNVFPIIMYGSAGMEKWDSK